MTNVVFSPSLQAPIVLSNPTGSVTAVCDPPGIVGKFPIIPQVGTIASVGYAVRLALSMQSNVGAIAFSGVTPTVIPGTVTPRQPSTGALSANGNSPTLTITSATALPFPRVMLVGNGGDQSYGSNASTGYPAWTTAAANSAAWTAVQTIGAYDAAILAGVFEGWDTNGARDRENLVQALLKNASYSVTKNTARPTLTFFYHMMGEGNPSGSGTGYDQLIAQINAMNGWLYESAGGVGTKTPSAFSGTLINYSTAWPVQIGSALTGQSIVGSNYGTTSAGSPTGAQGVARTNGNYVAEKLLIRGTSGDTRFTFDAQMAAPSCAGVFLDNCFVALDGAGPVANSSLDGITIAPGSQQGGGYPGLDTVQPVMARGIHNFFDQMQQMCALYGTPGKVYYNFGNLGQYANKYQFGTATLTCGLEGTMNGGLLEDVIGAGAPSWEYQQTGNPVGGNYASGWPNLLANYYQAMDFCLAPKIVGLGIRVPAADGSTTASWVVGGGSTLATVTAGTSLEYQEMRYGLCTALLDDGYYAQGASGYDWSKPRWYDEFGDDSLTQVNVKRGYLGSPLTTRPTAPKWAQGPMGVWWRGFTGGGSAVNPRGNGAQTVALGGIYKALQGTQQTSVNNGAYTQSLTLADGDGRVLLGPFVFPALQITTSSPLPGGTVGTAYSVTLSAVGGVAPYTWASTSFTPNTGGKLSLSSAGVVSGTPGTAETETLVAQVTDSVGQTASMTFTLAVSNAAVGSFAPNLPIGYTKIWDRVWNKTDSVLGTLPPATLSSSGQLDSYNMYWYNGDGTTQIPIIDTVANLSTRIGQTIPPPPDGNSTVLAVYYPTGYPGTQCPFRIVPNSPPNFKKVHVAFWVWMPKGFDSSGNQIKFLGVGSGSSANHIFMLLSGGGSPTTYDYRGVWLALQGNINGDLGGLENGPFAAVQCLPNPPPQGRGPGWWTPTGMEGQWVMCEWHAEQDTNGANGIFKSWVTINGVTTLINYWNNIGYQDPAGWAGYAFIPYYGGGGGSSPAPGQYIIVSRAAVYGSN